MSTEIERIKKLVREDLVVDAVELPANHKKKSHIVDDIEDVLNKFDDDMDYAHFIVRVKRSTGSISKLLDAPAKTTLSEGDPASGGETVTDFNSLVDQTLSSPVEKHQLPTDRDPEKDPEFLLANARLLEESGDYALARNIYSALLKIGAKLAEAHAGLASTFEKEGLFEQSIRHYREAIAYASELSFYQSLAALQIRTGDDKEAAKTLIHALGLGNIDEATRFELHKSLGNCFTRSGDYGKAEHHYARAYEYQPKSDTLQVNVGSLALQKNDISAALEHFQKAIELNPNNDKAICGVGMVHLSNGDIERAYDYFLAAVRSQPSNITALFNLAKCALDLRKYSDAAEALENYMKNSAPNVGILFSYAGILFHKGDIANASKEVERILKINASHAGAIELRDIIARRNKNE